MCGCARRPLPEAMPLSCLADFKGDSREVRRRHRSCHGFGEEMSYEVQDITGVVMPSGYISLSSLGEKL